VNLVDYKNQWRHQDLLRGAT